MRELSGPHREKGEQRQRTRRGAKFTEAEGISKLRGSCSFLGTAAAAKLFASVGTVRSIAESSPEAAAAFDSGSEDVRRGCPKRVSKEGSYACLRGQRTSSDVLALRILWQRFQRPAGGESAARSSCHRKPFGNCCRHWAQRTHSRTARYLEFVP